STYSAESADKSHQRARRILENSSAVGVWGILLQLGVEPRPRVSPVAIGSRGRNAEGLRGLGDRQAGEVAKLDEVGLERVHLFEAFERLVDGQDVEGRLRRGDLVVFDVLSPLPTASAPALLVPCLVDQDASHGL